MIIKNTNVYTENNTFELSNIYIQEDKIVNTVLGNDSNVIDGTGLYAIPGLIDIHFHGCVGSDFCDGTHEAIDTIARYQAKNGVTAICPATMTLDENTITNICRVASTYQGKEDTAILSGINMEGPFISPNKKGAQNEKYIHKPDIEMFRRIQKVSGNLIKLVSIAPEEDTTEFISTLKDEVVISLAHTTADYTIASEALQKGAKHVTHLYNAMPPFSHREPGVIGAALDNVHCNVELICDGIHVHPSVIRATFNMYGDDRIIMISDCMMATGLSDGDYSLGGQDVKVIGNTVTLADGTIAGSVTNLMDCVRYAVKEVGIPLEMAVKCASVNPAKVIGVYDNYGSISQGKVANIVILDSELNIKYVILKGKII